MAAMLLVMDAASFALAGYMEGPMAIVVGPLVTLINGCLLLLDWKTLNDYHT